MLGYPRIGRQRELKRALEAFWAHQGDPTELAETGRRIRAATWRRLDALGLEALPSNTFSLYDHVLDAAVLIDAVPERFRAEDPLDAYFAMARGTERTPALPMTKWFDTNYHYIVPEIGATTPLRLVGDKPLAEVREARALGFHTRPVLVGPATLLLLAQPAAGSRPGFAPLDRLDEVIAIYVELLAALRAEGVEWVQLDEPAFVGDRSGDALEALRHTYHQIGRTPQRPKVLVAAYFGDLGAALPILAEAPIEAVGLDLVAGRPHELPGKTVVAGVVSGRDVWRTDERRALGLLQAVRAEQVVVSSSCSLLHVPHDLDLEPELDPALRRRLAFADQKVAEIAALARLLPDAPPLPAPAPATPEPRHTPTTKPRSHFGVRAGAQSAHLKLPPLPVTTIGSFPQTGELRSARAAVVSGELTVERYEDRVRAEIERVIRLQERLGLDVLVHGEPERNDMVQYFAEHLDGFATTRHGWVQSYGSRCTRPPILHGDVARPAPITVRWARYAQSLTDRPVKGMLTGPVTIAAWSFVRDDLPLREVVWQVASAIRDEVRDLERAGIAVIQVDEPALRERMPLRRESQPAYLEWAVAAYRHATSGAGDRTQIHTHLCYSDAARIRSAIDALDADVTSIESARSGTRIGGFTRGLGPGVYDIHSPRIPTVEEVAAGLTEALREIPGDRLWVNPDCGLKTRTYHEVEAALTNVVAAARRVRSTLR